MSGKTGIGKEKAVRGNILTQDIPPRSPKEKAVRKSDLKLRVERVSRNRILAAKGKAVKE